MLSADCDETSSPKSEKAGSEPVERKGLYQAAAAG